MRTEQLIDCSLSKIRMQDVEKLLIKTDKLLCYTFRIFILLSYTFHEQ